MLYKLYPLDTVPRRGIVLGEVPEPVPIHTPASLAAAVRSSFPEMTVYEPKGRPFIVAQANLRVPPSLGPNIHERQRQYGEAALEAICRNENCRRESVATYRELSMAEKADLLRRHGFENMARALEKKQTR